MKKYIVALFAGLFFTQSYCPQIPMNPVSVLLPAYQQIFLFKKPLTKENTSLWYNGVNTITDFVISNSDNSKTVLAAINGINNISKQTISLLQEIRNLAAIVKTLKNREEKDQYKQPLDNKINQLKNNIFLAQGTINRLQQQAQIWNVLDGTIRFLQREIMSALEEELYNI